MENYLKKYLGDLEKVETFQKLLDWVVIPMLKDMKKNNKIIYMSLGCMSTGGAGAKLLGTTGRSLPRKSSKSVTIYDINIEIFKSIQDDIIKYSDNNIVLFNQMLLNETFMRIDSDYSNWELLVTDFYWKLFESGWIDAYILQPRWYQSKGTQKGLKRIMELRDPKILELKHDYLKNSKEVKSKIFSNIRWESIEYMKTMLR